MKLEKEARVHYISQNHQIGEVGHKITQAVITFVIDKELTSQESHFIDNLKNKEVKLIIEEKDPILDEEERKYLSGVIAPFRNKVKYITKIRWLGSSNESISILMEKNFIFTLPPFKMSLMYKNMELNKKYKLEDLAI